MAYYEEALAAAYVRGTMYNELPPNLAEKPLEDLTPADKEKLFQLGKEQGLLLYHFKEKNLLPRIQVVLGLLKNIYPQTLLDIGTGRGVFMVSF